MIKFKDNTYPDSTYYDDAASVIFNDANYGSSLYSTLRFKRSEEERLDQLVSQVGALAQLFIDKGLITGEEFLVALKLQNHYNVINVED